MDPFEIILLDIDGAVLKQKGLLDLHHPTVISLQEKAESLRFWCRIFEIESIKIIIDQSAHSNKRKLFFYGSGDYHHLAYLGISLIKEPFCLIQFDNHTDIWKPLKKGFIDFGSWVPRVFQFGNLKKVIQLGVDGDLRLAWYLPFPLGRHSHEIDLLCLGRVEIYPNKMRRSLLLGRYNGCLSSVKFLPNRFTTRLEWKNINDNGGMEVFIHQLLSTIPTEGIYITIDKDVLRESDNFAGYPMRQGSLTLDDLAIALSVLAKNKRILGADICGDGSYLRTASSIAKRLMIWQMTWAIPASKFTAEETIQRNEVSNLRIIEEISQTQ